MIIRMENMLHKKSKAPLMNNGNDHKNIYLILLKSVTKNTHVLLYSYFQKCYYCITKATKFRKLFCNF